MHSISKQWFNSRCLKIFKLDGEPNSTSELLLHVGCNNQGALNNTPTSTPQSNINIERRNGKEPINVVCEPLEENTNVF
jgi:hypothetical protein